MRDFSKVCWRLKFCPVVLRPGRKPYWVSSIFGSTISQHLHRGTIIIMWLECTFLEKLSIDVPWHTRCVWEFLPIWMFVGFYCNLQPSVFWQLARLKMICGMLFSFSKSYSCDTVVYDVTKFLKIWKAPHLARMSHPFLSKPLFSSWWISFRIRFLPVMTMHYWQITLLLIQ